ncbi:hypothetical protein [Clostridium sp. MSJ-8]|nr:hypothetical protein [Clostridium sp. MSJ-8]
MIYRYPDEYMYRVEYISDIEECETNNLIYAELDDEYVYDRVR